MIDQRVAIGIAVVGFVIAAFLLFGPGGGDDHGDNSASFPDGTYWMCSDPACGHEFKLTIKELSEHHEAHYGDPVPCAKCDKPAGRADLCKHCDKYFRVQRDSVTCPHCGKNVTETPGVD